MADTGSTKERREQARERARELREQERRRRVRTRVLVQSGVGLAIVAVVAIVVLVLVQANRPAGPGPANLSASGGIQFSGADFAPTTSAAIDAAATPHDIAVDDSDGKPHIVEYIDWACPICQQFESAYADQVKALVTSTGGTVEFRPVSILDRSYQGSRYASRAANVAACMANYDPDHYIDAQNAFYANQPAEGTTGLDDTAMLALLTDAGIDVDAAHGGTTLTDCVRSEQFKGWVTATTDNAAAAVPDPATGRFGTPTVYVNGQRYTLGDDFTAFVDQAVTTTAGSATSSPTPAPTSTN